MFNWRIGTANNGWSFSFLVGLLNSPLETLTRLWTLDVAEYVRIKGLQIFKMLEKVMWDRVLLLRLRWSSLVVMHTFMMQFRSNSFCRHYLLPTILYIWYIPTLFNRCYLFYVVWNDPWKSHWQKGKPLGISGKLRCPITKTKTPRLQEQCALVDWRLFTPKAEYKSRSSHGSTLEERRKGKECTSHLSS